MLLPTDGVCLRKLLVERLLHMFKVRFNTEAACADESFTGIISRSEKSQNSRKFTEQRDGGTIQKRN